MIPTINSRGQAAIESALALPIAFVGATSFLVLLWSLAVSMLTHHTLYEMLICYETYGSSSECQQTARSTIEHFLLIGHLDQLSYEHHEAYSLASANVSFPLRLHLHLKESLHLPLVSTGTESLLKEAL